MTRLYAPRPVPVTDPDTFDDEADWAAQSLRDAEQRYAFRANTDEE